MRLLVPIILVLALALTACSGTAPPGEAATPVATPPPVSIPDFTVLGRSWGVINQFGYVEYVVAYKGAERYIQIPTSWEECNVYFLGTILPRNCR